MPSGVYCVVLVGKCQNGSSAIYLIWSALYDHGEKYLIIVILTLITAHLKLIFNMGLV